MVKFIGHGWRRLSSNKRSVLSIFSGIAAGQLLALVTAPLLSRLYSPTDFGVFATCSALIFTIGTIAALRFEFAVPLPALDRDAYALVALGAIAASLVGLLCTIVIALGGSSIARALGQPNLMPWLWLVPPSATAMSYYIVLNQLAIRQRRFATIGRRSLFQSVTIVVAQIGGGLTGFRPGGLVAGFGLGQLVSAASLLAGSGLCGETARDGRKPAVLRRMAHRYRRFPLILGPYGFLNVLGLQLPVILIGAWYGGQVVGWLGLTQRVLALPVALIGTAVAHVYLSEVARAARESLQSALQLFYRASMGLAAAGLSLLVLLLIFGPHLFSWVFGDEWLRSGQYSQALAIGLAVQMVAVPLSQTLTVLEKQHLQLTFDSLRVLLIFAVVFAMKSAGAEPIAVIWAVGCVLATTYALSWIFSWRSLTKAVRTATG